jgi:predicted transcriptional regulator
MKYYNRKIELYKENKIEGKDYIICQICKERFSQISTHLKLSHKNFSKKEYLERFPNAPLYCEEFLKTSLGKRKLRDKNTGTVDIKGKLENEDYIICKICNNAFLNLNNHALRHGLTISEYKKKFPEALLICNREREGISKKLNGVSIENRLGKERADEISKKISGDHKTRKERGVYQKASNALKGRSKEELFGEERVKEMKQNLSIKNKGKTYEERCSVEGAKRLREGVKKSVDNRRGKKRDPEIGKKISKTNKGKPVPLERRTRISNTLRKGHIEGRIKNVGGDPVKGRQIYYQTPIQGIKLLRSSTELKYVQILNKQSNFGKDFLWLYEPIKYSVDMKDGEVFRTITPDFQLLFDWNIDRVKKEFGRDTLTKEEVQDICNRSYDRKIEETKGYWGMKHYGFNKWNLFLEQYPDEKIEIIVDKTVDNLYKRNFA